MVVAAAATLFSEPKSNSQPSLRSSSSEGRNRVMEGGSDGSRGKREGGEDDDKAVGRSMVAPLQRREDFSPSSVVADGAWGGGIGGDESFVPAAPARTTLSRSPTECIMWTRRLLSWNRLTG